MPRRTVTRMMPGLAPLAAAAAVAAAAAAPALVPRAMAAEVRAMAPERADLRDYRWSARPLLIFAASPDDPRLRAALEALKGRDAALDDREIVVLTDTDPAARGGLREGLGVSGFRMMLVGLDGGVKMDETAPIPVDRLLETIDRMPMRRNRG
ncbi:DUF4174 domain-containing protein [Frigidibacter sp. MR17.24]|uniref:DUF4174 domain-containing protein n=1 Tax=Frigidibacter sp. MR17.24 TaxID=3127345 RepID=UPI003012DA55